MQKMFLSLASVFGATAVMLGAFGAHALKSKLTTEQLQVYETGVRYQMYHVFALIAVAFLIDKYPGKSVLNYAGYSFMAGIVLFSGSLYLLSTKQLLGMESAKWLGPVTPLGGLFFIMGWALLLAAVLGKSNNVTV